MAFLVNSEAYFPPSQFRIPPLRLPLNCGEVPLPQGMEKRLHLGRSLPRLAPGKCVILPVSWGL